MKNTWKLFWGIGFILVAVALVLDALGILAPISGAIGDVSVIAVIAGLLLLCFTLAMLFRARLGEAVVSLALIFMLFEQNIAYAFKIGDENGNIINNWLLLLCAVMVWIGFSILFSGIRRKRLGKIKGVKINGHRTASIGSSVKYIDCEGFKHEFVENDLGSCVVFFENTDKYVGGGVLHIDNNLGSMVINVPADWVVAVNIDNSLGSVQAPKQVGQGPQLSVTGDNNLGSVVIKRV